MRWLSSLIPVVVLSAPGLAAQALGSIIGSVRTFGEGAVIEGARIELVGTKHATMTSSKGEFSLRNLTPGKYVIQASAIGFTKLSAEVEIREGEILEVAFEAQVEAVRLPELAVSESPRLPPEFMRRSTEGGGRYMSRAQIERRPGAATVADLLRQFPGVRLNCRRYPCTAEFTRTTRSCPPAFFLDGIQTESANIMMQPAREVDGIEVYSGLAETPPELKGRNNCGAFVVWTRIPPDARKRKS
ncbi:MAG: carboxypeptidase regulatory-like domain-containing protein [Gemmatimonadales bacterium]